METVLKGAVYDITKLVEESFLEEVMRSRHEIKALTEKLQSSERRWREGDGLGQARLKHVDYGKGELLRQRGTRGSAEKQSGVEEWFDVREGKMKQGVGPWNPLDRTSPERPAEVATCTPTRALETAPETPKHLDRDEFDIVCKEENVKEAPCGNQERHRTHLDGFEAAYHVYGSPQEPGFVELSGVILEAEVSPVEVIADQPRLRRKQGDIYALDSLKNSESALDNVSERSDNTGTEQSTGLLNDQGFDYVIREAAGRQHTIFAQGNRHMVPEEPVISMSAEQDSDGQSDQEHTSNTLPTLGSLVEKTESIFADPVIVKDEEEIQWNDETRSAETHGQHSQRRESREKLLQIHFPSIPSQADASWFQKLCSLKSKNTAPDPAEMQHEVERVQIMDTEQTIQGIADASKETEAFVYGTEFTASGNTATHQSASTEEKSFSCLHCGKSFTLLRNLKDHQRYHTGKKSYTCTQCGKGFVYMCHLKVHLQSHTGERPFSCTLCGKSFTYLCNLKSHQLYHTGEKPFSCIQCGKRFSQLSHLKKHRLIHSGDRPHGCRDCGKRFCTNGELRRHQQIHAR